MDKNHQIEEMAKILTNSSELDTFAYYEALVKAKALYNAGYRKLENIIDLYTVKKEYNAYMGYDDYVVITPTIHTYRFRTELEAREFVASLKAQE